MPDWSGFQCGTTKILARAGSAPDGKTKRALYIAKNINEKNRFFIRSNQIACKCRRYIKSHWRDGTPTIIARSHTIKTDYYNGEYYFSFFNNAKVFPHYKAANIMKKLTNDWPGYEFELIEVKE